MMGQRFREERLQFSFLMVPLSYIGLVITFAFSLDIFIVLFISSWWYLGLISAAFYLNIRQSTRLETPLKISNVKLPIFGYASSH